MTLQKAIYDVATGETITRDYNETELADHETDKAKTEKDAKAKAKAEQMLADKRQTILDRLGISADELKTILP
tara:strand:- start:565 stop:783 length:219 start_codon:yes stop_codon:yes gene_type:complete